MSLTKKKKKGLFLGVLCIMSAAALDYYREYCHILFFLPVMFIGDGCSHIVG